MTWHMRTTGVPAQTATQLDAYLLATLEQLVQTHDLAAELKEKYWHPIDLDGLGLQSVSAARLDAQAASWALCDKPVLQRLEFNDRESLRHHCPGLGPVLQHLQHTVNALTDTMATPHSDRSTPTSLGPKHDRKVGRRVARAPHAPRPPSRRRPLPGCVETQTRRTGPSSRGPLSFQEGGRNPLQRHRRHLRTPHSLLLIWRLHG